MTVEQLGNLAKNRFPSTYQGKSDREIGLSLMREHYAYRGRQKVPEDKVPETTTPITESENKYPNMPEGYNPAGVVQYSSPIGPEPAPIPKEKGSIQTGNSVANALGNTGLGITKGVASSILGLASLPKKGGEALAGMITSMMGMDKSVLEQGQKIQSIKEKVEATGALKTKGAAEKFGKGLEQLSEFFIPVGKGKGVEEGLKVIERISKPGSIISKLATKPVVSKMAQEGLNFGGITAIQKGDVNKDVGTAAEVGATYPIFGMAGRLAIKGSSAIQEKLWVDILKRTKDSITKHPIAMDVAKQHIVALSTDRVNKTINKEVEKLTTQLSEKLTTKESAIKVSTFKEKLIRTATKELEKSATKYEPLIKDYKLLTRAAVDTIVNKYIKSGQKTISRTNALKLALHLSREVENKVVSNSKDSIAIPKIIAKELLDRTKKILPEMKDKVTRIAVLTEALPAMRRSINTGKAAPILSKYEWGIGLAGEVLGAGGLKLVGIKKTYESTAFKSSLSAILHIFNSLANPDKIPFYLGVKAFLAKTVDEIINE